MPVTSSVVWKKNSPKNANRTSTTFYILKRLFPQTCINAIQGKGEIASWKKIKVLATQIYRKYEDLILSYSYTKINFKVTTRLN